MHPLSNPNRCEACKFARRRCKKTCIFAPYFPPEEPQKFNKIEKVFGVPHIGRILARLRPDQREAAVNSLVYEAEAWLRNPGQGCAGIISSLQAELKQLKEEVGEAKIELAKYVGPQALTTILQPMPQHMGNPPSWKLAVEAPHIGQLVVREPPQQ